MATAVEEPDLFNGLEITEMDEINMENGDEYVFIPSDNENEDENGPSSHVSLASQSVFKTSVLSDMAIPIVQPIDAVNQHLLTSIDLDSALRQTVDNARVKDGEIIIVKNIDLTEEDEVVNEQDDQRFTVSYDFNLDMQQLLNIEHADDIPAEVTIKEEIDIGETVVNIPNDDDNNSSEVQLDLIDHDEHIVGSEVITLDSDASESENEEDCVIMALLEQCPSIIKEEGPDEDRTHVENDHAYTSQPTDDKIVPETNIPKPNATVQALVDISKRLLDEGPTSDLDLDETLKDIANLEEQLKLIKDKLLQKDTTSDDKEDTTKEPRAVINEVNSLSNEPPSRKESSETDTLSVELSENCSERLECCSVSDSAAISSEIGDKNNETVGQKTAEPSSETNTIDVETNHKTGCLSDLSQVLSPNASEPMEYDTESRAVSEDHINTTESIQTKNIDQENKKEPLSVQEHTEQFNAELVGKENVNIAQQDKNASAEEKTIQNTLTVNNLEDLIAFGAMFTKECENWIDKINNNFRQSSEEGVEKESSLAQKEQFYKAESFMNSLTKDVQRIALKAASRDKRKPVRIEASVQTEKTQRIGVNAKALNEKYKKRLLSSLAETEVAEHGSSDSDGESNVSNDGDSRSSDAVDAGAYGDPDDDDDDAAFERRQNRRKSKRLRQQMTTERQQSEENKSDEDTVQPSKKRHARRISSTNSSSDKEDSPGKSSFDAMLDESEEIIVKNEPYRENDSDSRNNSHSMNTTANADDSVEAIEDLDGTGQQETLINITPSQSNTNLSQVERLREENDAANKERSEEDGDEQSESGLLDDVLGQVDDILLDVNDILPAAEDVVQDYLVEEEVRTEQEVDNREPKQETNKKKEKPIRSGKTIDSEGDDEDASDHDEKEKGKAIEDMTESELEDYYDNLREKEIDKLCNLTNLEVARNTYTQKPQEVKKKPVVAKKKERVMDEILNEFESHHESEESDSDTEVLETEELFLQKCNENMKNQLLNQLSSSDTEQDSGSEDSVVEALKQEVDNDSDDSAGSILMEKFLKSLDKNHDVSGDEDAKDQEDGKTDNVMNSSVPTENLEAGNNGKSEKDFVDDSGIPKSDNEEIMDKKKNNLNNLDRKKSENATSKEKHQTKPNDGSTNRTAAIDPIDKQLFSKKMFREVDDTLRKDRERDVFGKENGSVTGHSERIGSDDSDVELLDVSMFKPKRKMKERKLQDFDFSSSTKRLTLQTKRGNPKDGDCISLSSESEAEVEETTTAETDEKENKQRKIRTMLTQDQLADETKTAQKDEDIRLSRLKKKNENLKKFLTTYKPGPEESDLVLDYDAKLDKAICVHPEIVKLLKPHQKEGVRFMYDNTYGSVEYINKNHGSGCILAHCMGLGKTLQLITLLHTVMRYPQLRTKRVLVICPKSTVMNWSDEIQHWLGSLKSGPRLKVFYFPDNSDVNDKLKVLSDWYSSTANRCGCMLIGYEAFRILVNYEKRKRTPSNILAAKAAFVKKKVDEYLLNPGADLVICDEGHQIKNKKSAISGAVSQIKTKRRIVLTGTPIQNNLKEYYCMVNFIKPSFLGSDREFNNLYGNPIKNGQHKDSDSRAIKIMKQRSYVLHNKLSRFVQRREAGVLKEFLPEKFEYVLFVPLTPVQEKMYEVFLQMNEYTTSTGEAGEAAKGKKFKLLADYTSLRKIWTHPKVLEKAWETAVQEKNKRDARFRLTSTPDSDDDRPDDYNDISSGALSVTNDWWRKHLEANDLESLYPSGKLRIMFEILKQCHERGEKCLIFSAFVAVLNVVEHFMNKIHNRENDQMADLYGYSTFKGPWEPGKDYYRLDGKTQKNIRHRMITSFNDPSNKRTKCFLISAKAGGQGINLIGANRVIILDTSWNPSNDQQNIFRIFRLGQKKKCYVYRLLAMGTMEEKVYSRSVTKQAMSFRVVDEQQIDRHYSFSELAELYSLSKVAEQVRETPILPADDLLASLLRNYPDCAFKYHEHDSLLENKPEQDLSEEDKREAWAAYEREIQNNEKPSYPGSLGMLPNFMSSMFPSGPGVGIGPYPPLNYTGLPGALADMYRSDFGYGSSMNRLMYPYSSPSFPMVNDPSYSSIMGKSPYQNFSLPGTSGSLPDYGLSAAMNGQAPTGNTNYNSTVALQSLLDLYAKSMSNAMSSSTITTATATSVSPSTSTSAAGVSSYNALSSLKQFNGFPSISPISSTPMPHSSPQIPPPKTSQSPSSASGNAALINLLNEQPMPMSSAASSGPFSHLSSPLPAPSIHVPRNVVTTTATTIPSPVLSTSPVSKTIPSTSSPALAAPQPPPRTSSYKPPEPAKGVNPKPVSLTTTIVASDDDDVDDDGIPRPHIIVRDPSSINASSSKTQQDQEKIVKKINMGIVYPEEKKKDQSKDIMLSAKSITTLAKPTIAVKNVESMKAVHPLSTNSKTSSPVSAVSRTGSTGSKPIRASPVQNSQASLPKPHQAVKQHQHSQQHPLIRTPLTGSTPALSMKQSPSPRQQVPVITSAKSLQLSSPNLSSGGFNVQMQRTPPSSSTSSASPTPNSTVPRGVIAAQQLRELQQRINQGNNNSNSISNSNSTSSSPLVMARTKKAATQLASSNQRPIGTKPQAAHPVGIFASHVQNNQKHTKSAIAAATTASTPVVTTTSSITTGVTGNTTVGRINKSLSDNVSITKITGSGQRIAMSTPSILNSPTSNSNSNNNMASLSPNLLKTSLGRKQDLIITKTSPGAATVRKMIPGSNMVIKAHSPIAGTTPKRNFLPMTSNIKNSAITGTSSLIQPASVISSGSGISLPSGITTSNSITVRKRKATEPTLIDSLKAKNNSITISEVRSIYQPPAKKPSQSLPVAAQKRFGSGITITPRKPTPQQQQQNILEVVEIE